MKSFYLGIALVFFATNALASNQFVEINGGMDSGGGKGVVCFNRAATNSKVISQARAIYDEDLNDIKSIAMLDFQYAVDSFGAKELIGSEDGSQEYQIADRAIWKKLQFAPFLKDRIWYNYSKISGNIRMRTAPLKGTYDENDMAIYENANCVLTQLAVQQDLSPKLTVVHIDSRLFNHIKHSEQSKFSLKMHEGIYFYLRKNAEAVNSAFTRELVANILLNQRRGGEELVQIFIDSGFLPGPPNLGTEGSGYTFDEIFNPRHYLQPNSIVLRYALSISVKFSDELVHMGFVYQLKNSGWTERAASALGRNDFPSEMFKKMNFQAGVNPTFDSLCKEYLSIFENSMNQFNSELEEDIIEMKKEYHESTIEDKNESQFELMLHDLRKLAQAYSQLYLQDSKELKKMNDIIPNVREQLIKLLGMDLYLKYEALSPFFMKTTNREDQIPETHPSVFNLPTTMKQSKGSEYYNTQFLLHLYEGLIESSSFQENSFSNVTVPEV